MSRSADADEDFGLLLELGVEYDVSRLHLAHRPHFAQVSANRHLRLIRPYGEKYQNGGAAPPDFARSRSGWGRGSEPVKGAGQAQR